MVAPHGLQKLMTSSKFSALMTHDMQVRRRLFATTCPRLVDNKCAAGDNDSITWSMISILTDWLVEVRDHLGIHPESLALALHLLNCCINSKNIATDVLWSRGYLQTWGVTCLWVACKHVEVWPPIVDEFANMCDGAASQANLLRCEFDILQYADFELNIPTPHTFASLFVESSKSWLATETRELLEFILVIDQTWLTAPQDWGVQFPASLRAACALSLAHRITVQTTNDQPHSAIDALLQKCAGDESTTETIQNCSAHIERKCRMYLSEQHGLDCAKRMWISRATEHGVHCPDALLHTLASQCSSIS